MSSSKCPRAHSFKTLPALETSILRAGSVLIRMHGPAYPANSFNPNVGKRIDVAIDGARFNPFPGSGSSNVPTLYAADDFSAAALESVFHAVDHVPSPTYLRTQLSQWRHTELEL